MSMGISITPGLTTTGRYVVTFREGANAAGVAALRKSGGISKANLMSSADFGESVADISQVPEHGGIVFQNLGIAVLNMEPGMAGAFSTATSDNPAILAIEPEGIMYALSELPGLSLEYLRGFRDAVEALYAKAIDTDGRSTAALSSAFVDTDALTWGLQASKVDVSKHTGRGIRVAVLDTGLDFLHPDFQGRNIVSASFIQGVSSAQDGHGHGTHCAGTACGPLRPGVGRRYGVAYDADLYIGKVLSDQGSGGDIGILAGIDWALTNECHVISMSLGADVPSTTVAYETAGERALNAGTLIVAAAGNNASRGFNNFGFVGRPANSRSMMAVGAVDAEMAMGNFSARDTILAAGTAVDIAGPGVSVYSAWPMPTRHRSINGTSMATPHVAGIAALWAEYTGKRGHALWDAVVSHAAALPLPIEDVGKGLVQAP